ncbi:MAG: orotate phosphoribosyltransferase [Thermogutta sp.]|mgnify:CR=1 FL=1|nr:orotate phosphoribosyltransferase [Thermogutta sp.]HOP77970.1 orotate phosphoribosyltransferase [Thermogutta sp.]HPU06793.1 orotate phosphoribosyltransferase [Thermogutta sp.]HQF14707.1 orotate phosphoribosyltransferase [Thermogutta sp.]
MFDRERLRDLILQKALHFGQFTLASGKTSTYYLDCRKITLDPEGARLVGEGILDILLQSSFPDAVGGMAIGADPITAAVVTMSAVRGTPIRGFMVRKEPKGHGTQQYIEGPVEPGDRVAILEDVLTTGGSALKAIERAVAFGLHVTQVIGIIDRLEGAGQAFAERGYPFAALFTIRDFGIEPNPA